MNFSVSDNSKPFIGNLINEQLITYNGTPVMGTFPQKVNIITTPQSLVWKDDKYMSETLFNVTVVGTDRDIILDEKVVASNQENAKFLSGVYDLLRELRITLDDVTVLVSPLGTVKVSKDI